MNSDEADFVFPSEPGQLDWILESFVERVPGAFCAVLASGDGVRRGTHGLDTDSADHLSAIVTGLRSLAKGVGKVTGTPGQVRQVVVEHDSALLFVSAAGRGSVLGVLADHDADANVVGHEMAALVTSLREHLGTPVRTA
ncbi:roadblock/LC7 domain-containing protein [Streptomyces scopuliridis]|uniref:Roadblock/LC7 domain-containing protein n=1 Tax=Streptomyces scopuliridis TaxID=452529 RepID=A0ACD4ZTH8_9ACTN|nr:roadblock/LC7 domain-containing protein [Streptomyces scopuliridis]WSC01709.1 roadblock/LC7 domain-containing protein [Streptomyces scopuliridis]WSC04752.1 roadblock/LC7 domain-containing protein [Streptomyces scopuliridis]